MKTQKQVKNDEGVWSKNQKMLESFSTYCLEHPELRFWQALVNWNGTNICTVTFKGKDVLYRDVFYE